MGSCGGEERRKRPWRGGKAGRAFSACLQDRLNERSGRHSVHLLLRGVRPEGGVEGEAARLEALGAEVVVRRGVLGEGHLRGRRKGRGGGADG